MRLPKFPISRLMAWIVVIALNLAAFRLLKTTDDLLVSGLVPIGLSVQWAVYRAIKGRRRAFWAGFAVAGTLTAASYCGLRYSRDSWPATWWDAYIEFAFEWLDLLPGSVLRVMQANPTAGDVTNALVDLVPHLSISVACGMMASAAMWIRSHGDRGNEGKSSVLASSTATGS